MKKVKVVLSYCGNVFVATFEVPAEELATEYSRRRFKNLLETQPTVCTFEIQD